MHRQYFEPPSSFYYSVLYAYYVKVDASITYRAILNETRCQAPLNTSPTHMKLAQIQDPCRKKKKMANQFGHHIYEAREG